MASEPLARCDRLELDPLSWPALLARQDEAALRLQRAWKGHLARRRAVAVLAKSYVHDVVGRAYQGFAPRTLAKLFIKARNGKIERLRRERREGRFLDFFSGSFAEDEIRQQQMNEKHRLRAALILQSWWKGATLRRQLKRYAAAADFFVGPEDEEDWASPSYSSQQEAQPWPLQIGSFASYFASYVWPQPVECYASTKVPRIAVPERRTFTSDQPRRIKVFFSDTGGGHRASALALQAAFERQFEEQVEVRLVDFFREATPWPLNQAPEVYQYMGHIPSVYKKIYEHEQEQHSWRATSSFKLLWMRSRETVLKFLTETISSGVDLIVSVHPLVNHLVMEALAEVFEGRCIVPVVTVVTDLGTAHLSWFDPRVDLIFVPSAEIEQLARRSGVARARLHLCGLPVREGFWEPEQRGKAELQRALNLDSAHPIVLLMGGGEGFGSLLELAKAIGERIAGAGQLVIICGRNEEVRGALQSHAWPAEPVILGFTTNIDEYMAAADMLVTKAGPGSIAEAMIKGLPCLLTSFVPGQEEGNVTFVTSAGAGAFVPETQPEDVADTVLQWLQAPALLAEMAERARGLARPKAALEIAGRVGSRLLDLGVEMAEGRAPVKPDLEMDELSRVLGS